MRILDDKRIIKALKCPICEAGMRVLGGALVCEGARPHCYDFASSGYVNLCAPTQSGGGDSKQAVKARSSFLNADYYRPVAQAVAEVCRRYGKEKDLLLDAGCGEGYYGAFMAKEGFSVMGADVSKFAVDAASKRLAKQGEENFFFAVASIFSLPVFDGEVDLITNVFAPCAEEEFLRVLKPDGTLVVVWAGERHLWGLKEALYEEAHINAERADMPQNMQKAEEIRVRYTVDICSQEHINSLFAMTPYYWRTSAKDVDKLSGMDKLKTEVDVMISVFKKNTDC